MAHAGSDERDLEPQLPRETWERIVSRPQRLIILDYDGTLTPLRVDRTLARPSPGMMAALADAQGAPGTRIAIVSGRQLGELRSLLGGLQLRMFGEHGWDEWSPGFETVQHELEPLVARHLARAAQLAPGGNGLVERKRCSVVLHTRSLTSAEAAALETATESLWRPLEIARLLQVERIDGGLEIRAISRDKGAAVRELMCTCPPEALPIALGDDRTDEAIFREVAGQGIAIRVGNATSRSAARFRIGSVDGVEDFLREYSRLVRGEGTAS